MRAPHAFVMCLWLATGCERELSFGVLHEPFGDASDAQSDAGQRDPNAFSCTQRGPLQSLSDSTASACPTSLGYHYALCSCQDVWNERGGILVDGFDSRRAPYAPGTTSGSLAMHGPLNAKAGARVGGSLIVLGSAPLGGELLVGGNLAVAGALDGPFSVSVGGSARLAGDVRVPRLSVAGSLTLSESASLTPDAGAFTRAPLSISAPCRCDDTLDRAALIAAAEQDNDNAVRALDPMLALRATSAALELTLPCGRYYVDEIFGAHAITLHIGGRVALYIQDRILLDPGVPLAIDLADDAELDLFVLNGITANGPVTIGSPSAPTRVRIYAGNPQHNLYFRERALLSASLHAPTADLVADGPFELYGAALVRRAGSATALTLHYDRALHADDCAETRCSASASCRAPLRCDVDQCLP